MVDAEWCEGEMPEDGSMSCITKAVLPNSETFAFRNCAHFVWIQVKDSVNDLVSTSVEALNLLCEELNVLIWQV